MPLLEVNDDHIHVIDRGAGDVLLFLHAFPFQSAMWDYQLEAFEGTHRCLAVDLPGFGGSPPPPSEPPASMQRWANLVAGVLDQLGVDTATVVGCSMGGYLAMAMLRHHPDRVAQLVLSDTRALSDDGPGAARRTDTQQQIRSGSELTSLAKSLVESQLSSGSMARSDLVSYVHALADGATAEGWIAALEAMKTRPDSMLLLRQADLRGLVIVGELDRITPIADARSLRLLLKGELVVIPNVGHLPNIEDPIAFNEALATFLGVDLAEPEPAPEAETEAEPEAEAEATADVDAGDVTGSGTAAED
ncbi:MAG TPA: alpha/beta hydrolase [Acidimicrobiales bacterium]|nr:alpha/beta hydrolase [Acidimicrobiales bacterium]